MAEANPQLAALKGRRILVALSGGIACYKIASLVSTVAQVGADVTVMMTEAATRFVTPLTFQTLSGRPVYTSMWQAEENFDAQHIALARGCDLVILAPATANMLAKISHGICDDLVSTVICALPRETPVLIAPAMNTEMWNNPITQKNVAELRDTLNYQFIGPDEGWQACRTSGAGRMSEADDIVAAAASLLE